MNSLLILVALSNASLTLKSDGGFYDLRSGNNLVRHCKSPITAPELSHFQGSRTLLATWRESGTEYSAVSLDGERFVKVQPIDTKLRFRWQEFDPTVEVAVVPKSFRNAPTNWMIVQFRSQVLPEFHDAIRTLGGEILTYMPENALVCKLDENERQEVEALPYVRYVGKYESIFRIDPSLVASLEANTLPVQRYQIQVSDWNGVQKPQLAQRIQAIGGQTYGDYSGGAFLHATLTCEQLKAVCKMEEVIFVNEASAPENDMDIVRSVQGPNIVEAAPGNYKGQGIRGEVFDSGALATHVDFAHNGGITFRSNSSNNSHGTSTTGIVFGDGTGQAQGRGMLPACQGIFGTYGSIVVGGGSMSRYDWTAALVSTPLFGMFQSNSWGSSQVTAYTTQSTEMDQIIFNLDIPILNSQSNTGAQTSRPEAWAKNVISIGGISHFNTAALTDDQWTSASFGPAADGRIKPDISNWYDNIYCPTNTATTAYTPTFNGTSSATPISAGHTGLFLQMYTDGLFGDSMPGSSPFANKPHFSLTKAFMINQAAQYPFTGSSATNNRMKQGWGLASTNGMYGSKNKIFSVNETDVLTNLQSKTYALYVTTGTPELKATLVYSDPPGTTSASLHRINDLTLKVTSPTGTIYYGNNGLAAGNYSTSGGSPNTIDTVENVILANPAAGAWTVEVIASQINMDSHLETGGIDADYALVVGGVANSALPNSSTLLYGDATSGTVSDMETSNNKRLVLLAPPLDGFDAFSEPIIQVITGLVSSPTTSTLKFRIESYSSQPDVTQQVALFNYVTNAYVNFDTSAVAFTEGVREITISSGASDYVKTGASKEVKAKITWTHLITDDVLWNISVDQARWFYNP